MNNRILQATLAMCLTGAAVQSHAGVIFWESPSDTISPQDVITQGTTLEAVNLSSREADEALMNGVEFNPADDKLSSSFSGNALAGSSTSSPSYDTLLNSFDFGNGIAFTLPVGDGQLQIGLNYLVQAWYTDLRSCCSARTMTLGDGLGNSVDISAIGEGLGQYAVGLFRADGDNQNLRLTTNGFKNVHLNAFQVRQIDEGDSYFRTLNDRISLAGNLSIDDDPVDGGLQDPSPGDPAQPVPAPGSLLLLLLGLVGVRKRGMRRRGNNTPNCSG